MQYNRNTQLNVLCQDDWKSCTEDWCVTQVKMAKFSYAWTITNFCVCAKLCKCLKSSEFPTTVNGGVGCRAHIKFYFLNSKGQKVNVYDTTQFFSPGHEEGYIYRFTKDDLVTKNNFLPGDKLTIFTEVRVIAEKSNKTSQTYMANFNEPECKLIDNFESILNKEKFCDVTLVVNGVDVKAHKAILAARSEVFAAMFDHDMMEKDKNVVTITDINTDIFKEMLHFIYTGKAPKIDKMANELLPVADKYALRKLKSMCEVALYRNLNEENATEILILADLHNSKQLKMHAVNFINTYPTIVVKPEDWTKWIEAHPKFIAENNLNI